eukprot:CAMPEP_0114618456 /NCGR_PEP_ID=MMETSP0168-20121206/7711_1 /TAXON_ID=95228 ORGANISM="Vannella sp., Strain DIVA3 517/6/12" /NCGR_SAMPLE_ID=MMETSP0168 /ASSEMBLY_ACC=CAM_ASM_000044 /LENGTH=103 /DNA_ID=CAMNT_0001829601 /DNA_START=83 /DNA_END=394 /DNA_ORIENTATION=-
MSEAPDMTGWTDEEIEFFKKYGRKKPAKKEFMQKRLKGRDKAQRFDSADFELKKQAGGRMRPMPKGMMTKKELPPHVRATMEQQQKKAEEAAAAEAAAGAAEE